MVKLYGLDLLLLLLNVLAAICTSGLKFEVLAALLTCFDLKLLCLDLLLFTLKVDTYCFFWEALTLLLFCSF